MTTPGQLAYRVVVRGIKPEQPVDQVVEALSRLSKTPPAALRLLLDGRKVVFKRTSDVHRAAAYKRTLDMIGCVCSIEPEAPLADPDAPAFTVNFRTAEITPAHGRGREFQFAKRPSARELLVAYLSANRVTLAVALVLVLYLGYKLAPGFV